MAKFETILSAATPSDFKFVNQRTCKVIGLFGNRTVSYRLTKSDVILAIKEYTKRIHSFTDKSIRAEDMNFGVFKMHDLVPYLYTLINLFVTVGATSYSYHRFLPELKLTRFCHLPFEDEVIVNELPVLEVECALLSSPLTKTRSYVALLNYGHSVSYLSIDELRDKFQSLYPLYHVVVTVR